MCSGPFDRLSLLDCIGGCTVAFAGLGVRTEDAEVMRSAHEDTFADDLCVEREKERNGLRLNRLCRAARTVESIMSTRSKAARVALIKWRRGALLACPLLT